MVREKLKLRTKTGSSIGVKMSKRINRLIEHYVMRDIHTTYGGLQTLKALV